jgi:hypothetical protein
MRGRERFLAHLPLPSMITAMWRGSFSVLASGFVIVSMRFPPLRLTNKKLGYLYV